MIPLSIDDIYGIDPEQIKVLIGIYGFKVNDLLYLVPITIIIGFSFYILIRLFKNKISKILTVSVLLLSTIFFIIKPLNPINFDSNIEYQSTINKTSFFIKSYLNYQNQEYTFLPDDIKKALDKYYKLHNFKKNKYYDYPFFNNEPLKDVLTPFFKPSNKPPNIVFIISESLGKQYSGKNANLTSFTPFLDSLANYSLYWENMVANAERTFGCLPNLMSGVPEGEKGFINLKWDTPDHLSLPLLLKENNNYQTGFFCGAWKHYDNMDEYLMFNKFDFILGKKDFSENKIITKINNNGNQINFNWGAEDLVVFKESMDFIKSNYDSLKPFFNLYLSTSFHEPFSYSLEREFIKKAEDIITSKVNKHEQDRYKTNIKEFAAIMYADYSMQQLFEIYKREGLYDNTIFIIVGDHSLKFMNENPRLEKYHIPFMIHSPLLKRFNNSKSIVCQKDVPSALQALLKNNFNLILPEFSISQTNQLDTNQKFSYKNNEFAMMYVNKSIKDYIAKNYFLSEGILFKIKDQLKIERNNDSKKLKELTDLLNNYKKLNNYVCYQNKYIPNKELMKYSLVKYETKFSNNFNKKLSGSFKKYNLSKKIFYSKPSSLQSNKKEYVSFLDTEITNKKRLRVIVQYKINSPSNYYPNLVLSTKNNSKQIDIHTIITENIIKSTEKKNWKEIKTGMWIDKNTIDSIIIYLHNFKKKQFYIDDLEIEIREF